MKQLKIALLGYGKMGQAVELEALQRGHQIVAKVDLKASEEDWKALKTADVVAEFTNPEQVLSNIQTILDMGIPLVTGTTGWQKELEAVERRVHEKGGSLVYSSNFSPGVNILFKVNEMLAKIMDRQVGYDVYVEEAHHRHKKDAPSGTALTLLEGLIGNLNEKNTWVAGDLASRPPHEDEISVGVVRAGGIVGKHSVAFRSDIDEIRISHEAFNRRGFALGAVLAAEWIQGKQGMFNFASFFS
jgi:4-hydroxy-tetrahydrodipicolinate reductase